VLGVRKGAREAAHGRGVQRAARDSEGDNPAETRPDLELAPADVVMRHPVAGDVEQRADDERAAPGAEERSRGCACGHV
jgi:hypothetical protein